MVLYMYITIITSTESTLAAESVPIISCHLIWPTDVVWCCDWLTHWLADQPWPAVLLWLVVQVIPQSLAASAKNKYPYPPSYCRCHLSLATAFLPLWDWPVHCPEEYLQYIHPWLPWHAVLTIEQKNTLETMVQLHACVVNTLVHLSCYHVSLLSFSACILHNNCLLNLCTSTLCLW